MTTFADKVKMFESKNETNKVTSQMKNLSLKVEKKAEEKTQEKVNWYQETNDSLEYKESPTENKFQEIDNSSGLVLNHFIDCDNDSSEGTKRNRGVVTDLEGNLVSKSFDFTEQYLANDSKLETIITPENFSKFTFYDSIEGTILRLYHYKGIPYLSTHKKLNAFDSKWGSKVSFGETFMIAISNLTKGKVNDFSDFTKNLDKDLTYVFLLPHTKENRIVCKAPEKETCYLLGMFRDGVYVNEKDKLPFEISFPTERKFENLKQVNEFVEKSVDFRKTQGIFARNGNKTLKIVNRKYDEYYSVRSNESSLKFRYLQLRFDTDKLKKLKELYPERCADFENYEKLIAKAVTVIYNAYVYKHIERNYVVVPQAQFNIMRICHSDYLSRRHTGFKVTMEHVKNVIDSRPASDLIQILKSLVKKNENYYHFPNSTY